MNDAQAFELAHWVNRARRAEATLKNLRYTDCGGELWKPPVQPTTLGPITAILPNKVQPFQSIFTPTTLVDYQKIASGIAA